MSKGERRKFPRAKLEQIAEVGHGADEGASRHQAVGGAADVSEGGVRFEARQGFDIGSRVNVSLAMNEDLVEANGKVVRFMIHEDGKVSMGIEFCDLTEENKKAIEQYCKKKSGGDTST